jgi:hypothetical protein
MRIVLSLVLLLADQVAGDGFRVVIYRSSLDVSASALPRAAALARLADGSRVDPSGSDLINDDAAIAKAKVLAIGIYIDKPAVDPKRHIAVLNGLREEIFRVSVYSKPSMSSI